MVGVDLYLNRWGRLLLFSATTLIFFLVFTPVESGNPKFSLGLRLLPFGILTLLLAVCFASKINYGKTDLIGVTALIAFYLIKNIGAISWEAFIFPISSMTTSIFVAMLYSIDDIREIFIDAIGAIICIWLIGFVVQFVGVYFFGYSIYPHDWIFPFSAQRVGGYFERYAGFHIEPGTYSAWMYAACLLRAILKKKIATRLHAIAVLSTLFTISAWAYAAVPFYFFAALLEMRWRKGALFLLAGGIIFVGLWIEFGDFLIDYTGRRYSTSDGSMGVRIGVYEYLLNYMQAWFPWGAQSSDLPCEIGNCLSTQDAGSWFNFLFYFGVLTLVLSFFWFWKMYRIMGLPGVVMSAPVWFGKYFIWDPIILMILMLVFSNRNFASNSWRAKIKL